jgi:hypothetical protein
MDWLCSAEAPPLADQAALRRTTGDVIRRQIGMTLYRGHPAAVDLEALLAE